MWELGLFPIQLLEAPDQIVIQAENVALPRRIYLDGRGHPAGHDLDVLDGAGKPGKVRGERPPAGL